MGKTDIVCANKLVLEHLGWEAGVIYHRVQHFSRKAEDGWYEPTNEPLYVTLSMPERTFRRSLDKLTQIGLLEKKRRQFSLAYRIVVQPDDLAAFLQSQSGQNGRSQSAKVTVRTCQSGRKDMPEWPLEDAKMAVRRCQNGRSAYSGTRVREDLEVLEVLEDKELPQSPSRGQPSAQPAPASKLNLASLDSIFEEALRRTQLPADHKHYQKALPFRREDLAVIDPDQWRQINEKREGIKGKWSYIAARNMLTKIVRCATEGWLQKSKLSREEIFAGLEHYLQSDGIAVNEDWLYERGRGRSQPKANSPQLSAADVRNQRHLRLANES